MVAGIGRNGEGLVSAMVDHYCPGGRYGTTRPGAGSYGVGVDSEAGCDGVIGGNIVEGVAAYGAYRCPVHQHINNMIAGIGRNGEGLISARINHHCPGGRYRSACTGGCGNSVGVDGVDSEAGSDGMVRRNIAKGVAGHRAD